MLALGIGILVAGLVILAWRFQRPGDGRQFPGSSDTSIDPSGIASDDSSGGHHRSLDSSTEGSPSDSGGAGGDSGSDGGGAAAD